MIRTLAYPAKHSVKKTIRHMVLGPFIRVLPRKGRAGEVFASIGSWSSRIRSSASSWLWECIESMLTRFRSDVADTDWWMLAGSLGPRSWLEPAIKTKFACLSFLGTRVWVGGVLLEIHRFPTVATNAHSLTQKRQQQSDKPAIDNGCFCLETIYKSLYAYKFCLIYFLSILFYTFLPD